MTRMDDYETEIRQFLVDNFLFGEEKLLHADESLMDAGLLDSTGVLELISHIEARYRIKVDDTELIPENLDTISNIGAFLKKKIS